jgi:DNA modification methylase
MAITLYHGDCLAVLRSLADSSISSIVCDPPYGLSDHTQDDIIACLSAWLAGEEYTHGKSGFMGRTWDSFVPGPEVWKECYRVLKPGGHLLAFAGTRTMDLMGLAIRLAGFELRDSIAWLYGQGMPKGLNIGKAIAKSGAEAGAWDGWHSSLKPSFEPLVVARRPLEGTIVQNTLTHGVGGLNIDACRLPIDPQIDDPRLGGAGTWGTGAMAKNVYGEYQGETVGSSPLGRFPANALHDGSDIVMKAFASFGDKTSGLPGTRRKAHETHSMSGRLNRTGETETGYGDSGSVARFYYAAKVSAKERGKSKHPTMKPLALMRYLLRLVTPLGGTVLDPFAGSGTTGQAALDEGFDAILIEREQEYVDYIRQRLDWFITEDILSD